MASEYESERESIATIMDIILLIRANKLQGKDTYTADELIELMCDFAESKKRRKP